MTKEQFEKVLFNKDTKVSFRDDIYRVIGIDFESAKLNIKEDRVPKSYDTLKSEYNVAIEAVELVHHIEQAEIIACMTVDRIAIAMDTEYKTADPTADAISL